MSWPDPPRHDGNSALWSGNVSNLDASAVTQVDGAGRPTRRSPTASCTWPRRPTTTRTPWSPPTAARPTPRWRTRTPSTGRTGRRSTVTPRTGRPRPSTCPRTPGKSIVVGFRYVSDGGVNDGGWYVDDVNVGDTRSTTAPPPRRSSPRRRCGRCGAQLRRCASSVSTPARGGQSCGTFGSELVQPHRGAARPVRRVPASRRDRVLRRADRAVSAAGDVPPDGERCGAAGRGAGDYLTPTGRAGGSYSPARPARCCLSPVPARVASPT